jgi:hypothetical protein
MTHDEMESAIIELQKLQKENGETLTRLICDYHSDKDDLITIRLIAFYKRKKNQYRKSLINWLMKGDKQ